MPISCGRTSTGSWMEALLNQERYQGRVYRSYDLRWAWDPLSGEGARRHGGRFNRKGVPAFYTALEYEVSMRERVGDSRMQPMVTCEYEVDVRPIFDSMDEQCCASVVVQPYELNCPNWEKEMHLGSIPASQKLADRLIEQGYAGMLVRSFASEYKASLETTMRDVNLVLWLYGDSPERQVKLVDDHGLIQSLRDVWATKLHDQT